MEYFQLHLMVFKCFWWWLGTLNSRSNDQNSFYLENSASKNEHCVLISTWEILRNLLLLLGLLVTGIHTPWICKRLWIPFTGEHSDFSWSSFAHQSSTTLLRLLPETFLPLQKDLLKLIIVWEIQAFRKWCQIYLRNVNACRLVKNNRHFLG